MESYASHITIEVHDTDGLISSVEYKFKRYLPQYAEDDLVREEWSSTTWSRYWNKTVESRTTAYPEEKTMEARVRELHDLEWLQTMVNPDITHVEITTN